MSIKKTIALAVLTSALSVPAIASSIPFGGDILYNNPGFNKNLESGEYDFASLHSRYGSTFKDSWKFTLAENAEVSISIFDLEASLGKQVTTPSTKMHGLHHRHNPFNSIKIFDTTKLTLSIFDSNGQLLGKTGENGTLSNLDLVAGSWYTIRVKGRVGGLFGSSYYGVLDLTPTPVPIGGAAPMLGSALTLLALRRRKLNTGSV